MNGRKAALPLLVLFFLASTSIAATEPSDGIIVSGAKQVMETTFSLASGLQGPLGQAPVRVVVEYAKGNRTDALPVIPSPLQTALGSLAERVSMQYAKGSLGRSLAYPAPLFNDATSPQITNAGVLVTSCRTALITWATNELADGAVSFGTEPGDYTGRASDPLYEWQHEFVLSGLPPSTPVYYQVQSSDRSGNTATIESWFQPACRYLPLMTSQSP